MDETYVDIREASDMGHPRRQDEPGAWHHVMTRGVGNRTLFDDDEDARAFLALLARVARLGLLEFIAFSLMPNHVHLLVRSPEGRLGDAMQYIEGVYDRGFNRRRGRNGALVRARYRSKPVRSDAYRRALVGYIDQNPVDAKLVADARDYPFGSARLYVRPSGPPWLCRGWVEAFACQRSGIPTFGPEAYDRAFGGPSREARARWIEAGMTGNFPDDLSLDQLILASPDYVRRWLDERSTLADGVRRNLPLADVDSVAATIAEAVRSAPDWTVKPRGRRRSAWTIIAVGLLREIAGQTHRQVAIRLAISDSAARKIEDEHGLLLQQDPMLRSISMRLAQSAIRRCHGDPSDGRRGG